MFMLLFVAFSWPWYALLGGWSLAMLYSLYDDATSECELRIWPSAALTAGLVAALVALGDFRPWELSLDSLWSLAAIAGAYLAIGSAWAGFFWFVPFLNRRKAEYEKVRDAWLESKSLPPGVVPEANRESLRNFLVDLSVYRSVGPNEYPYRGALNGKNPNGSRIYDVKLWPSWKDNKARVASWLLWWPWSAISFFAWDFLREIFNAAFASVSQWMDGLSRRRFAQFDGDIKPSEPKQ